MFLFPQSFRTVDSSIYALSDYTRFSRVYKDVAPHSTYDKNTYLSKARMSIDFDLLFYSYFDVRFNPNEVGSFVALKILEQQLDPTLSRPHRYANTDADQSALMAPHKPSQRPHRAPLPVFRLPRTVACELPGGLNYFCSRLPDAPIDTIGYLTNGQLTGGPADITTTPRNRNFMVKVMNNFKNYVS